MARQPDDLTVQLDRLLAAREIHPLFQPIVDLRTGETVAFEALARGPRDGALHLPDRLFAAARGAGKLGELDRLCQVRAIEAAVDGGLRTPFGLFVNVEPAGVDHVGLPAALLSAMRERGLRLVLELTERSLTADPARLLALADWARAHGWGVALDDIGADPDSLALMPFLRPDVLKLDLRLVQQRPNAEVADIMSAVTCYAEQSGAIVLAEGVETAGHARVARGLGATFAQGWLFGRPAPLPAAVDVPSRPLALHGDADRPVGRSPYALAATRRAPLRGPKSLLIAVSKLLEDKAANIGDLAVVVSAFEQARFFTPPTAMRYLRLAEAATFVGALGADLPAEPATGVRGADLAADDPVRGEWDIAVVGPHFAAALVARDLGVADTDVDRPFDYILTYDRDLVLEVARSLMSRFLPAAGRPVDPALIPVQAGRSLGTAPAAARPSRR